MVKIRENVVHGVWLPLDLLDEAENNPNEMNDREFDLLVGNMQKLKSDPMLVYAKEPQKVRMILESCPNLEAAGKALADAKTRFGIVGGHHRKKAWQYLQYEEGVCTIIVDPDFDEAARDMQLVRHNVIHGRMNPIKFSQLANKYVEKLGRDALAEFFGFADEAVLAKMLDSVSNSLPEQMKKKFEESRGEIKTIDDIARVLNRLYTLYGDTIPYGYMILDYGGKDSVWLRCAKPTYDALMVLGDVCREQKVAMDDLVGGVVRRLAAGEMPDVMKAVLEDADHVEVPEGPLLPTKDNVANQSKLQQALN
jgi:hypothetical protein